MILLEFGAGALLCKAAWDLWVARDASAAQFNASKYFTHVGAGLGLVIWFGLFTVFGGAFFQMWQTELGAASLQGSFQYLGSIALVTLFVSMPDV